MRPCPRKFRWENSQTVTDHIFGNKNFFEFAIVNKKCNQQTRGIWLLRAQVLMGSFSGAIAQFFDELPSTYGPLIELLDILIYLRSDV